MLNLLHRTQLVFLLSMSCVAVAADWDYAWFRTSGPWTACMVNPAAECPHVEAGPSPMERTMVRGLYTSIDLDYTKAYAIDSGDQSSRAAGTTFEVSTIGRFSRAGALGLEVSGPLPASRYWRSSDSMELAEVRSSPEAALLLGSDLLGWQTKQGASRLILSTRIPVFYSAGLWAGNLEYVRQGRWRLGVGIHHRIPRSEIAVLPDQDTLWRLKWQDRGVDANAALRLGRFDLGLQGSASRWKRSTGKTIPWMEGPVVRGGGILQWSSRKWRYSVSALGEDRDLSLGWQGDGEAMLDADMHGRNSVVNTQLSRVTIGGSRATLYGELRRQRWYGGDTEFLPDSGTGSWAAILEHLQDGAGDASWRGIGGSVFLYHAGYSLEPEVAWYRGRLDGVSPSWETRGVNPAALAGVLDCDALLLGGTFGIGTTDSRYRFSYHHPLRLRGGRLGNGFDAEWGGVFRVEIRGAL